MMKYTTIITCKIIYVTITKRDLFGETTEFTNLEFFHIIDTHMENNEIFRGKNCIRRYAILEIHLMS